MTFILRQLLKSAIRVEKKLDETLRQLKHLSDRNPGSAMVPYMEPLNQPGQGPCPLCNIPVKYQPVKVDGVPDTTILVRICGCEPQTIELPTHEGDI